MFIPKFIDNEKTQLSGKRGDPVMATRPVFVVSLDTKYCIRANTEFEFYPGFSEKQKQRSIRSLHQAFQKKNTDKKILEISSKSEEPIGIKLSAFNLMIKNKSGKLISVESAFQSSKVFERGGPYKDLLEMPSRVAKNDDRLRNSGKIISFQIDGKIFPTEPRTYFYNWLYINALNMNNDLADQIIDYDAFTDIAFNPQKSINCQAEAAAIYVSLRKQGLLKEALKNQDCFKRVVYPDFGNSITYDQVTLF